MDLKIEFLGGSVPVQGEGTIDGHPFYFRARHQHWSIIVSLDETRYYIMESYPCAGMGRGWERRDIDAEPISGPAWCYEEPYGEGPFDAGYMSSGEALAFIEQAAKAFLQQQAEGKD